MRALALTALAAALLATPALAQQNTSMPYIPGTLWDTGSRNSELNGRTADILATTPSRMERSRREMNRGRETVWERNMTPAQIRRSAVGALERAGYQCTVEDTDLVAQLRDGAPVIEVACAEDGGLIIADTNPVQATDCLDFVPGEGLFGPCRIPANIARVEALRGQ